MNIHFFSVTSGLHLSNRKLLKNFIGGLFKSEGKILGKLNYIFCSDEYLLIINKEYLSHDDYTDIITFDLSNDEKSAIEGEIYISLERVKDNAKSMGQPVVSELHRVIFHGALHLCGYKDKSASQKRNMRAMEEKYLKKWFHK